MICYKDKTFCKESTCKNFGPCPRTFTEEIRKGAEKWWGSKEAPVCFFISAPNCYEKKEERNE